MTGFEWIVVMVLSVPVVFSVAFAGVTIALRRLGPSPTGRHVTPSA